MRKTTLGRKRVLIKWGMRLGMLRARQIVLLQTSTGTWSLDGGGRERLEKIV